MLQNVFQKIPKKKQFLGDFSEQQLWPGRNNAIFSHKEHSQNFVIFSAKTSKKRPRRWVRRHDKNKYPRKGNMYSGKFPKKCRFFLGFFEMETART